MRFTRGSAITIIIEETKPLDSSYIVDYHGTPVNYKCEYSFIYNLLKDGEWQLKETDLDLAFNEVDKVICSHYNIREDRFFSAMVYKTCKDCGKTLN